MGIDRATVRRHFGQGFRAKDDRRAGKLRRIGLELKFPAVGRDGRACDADFARVLC